MSSDGPTFTVPVSRGSRLHFSWGLGTELRLLDIQDPSAKQGGDGGHATHVSWGQVSSSNRIISFGTAEQYAEVQRARLSGCRDDAQLARVASYARTVREQLMDLRSDDDDGLSQLEAALWHLIELFFVDAPRSDGNLGEDFVHWLAAHHDALATLTAQPTLSGRIEELRQDPSAAAQPDYWAVVRRLVALGRTAEALELLDCHDAKRAVAGGGARGAAGALQQPGLRAQLELLDCLHVLLKRLPRLAPSGGRDPTSRAYTSLAEFTAARGLWLREAQEIAGSEHLFAAAGAASRRTAEGVRSVMGVLLGQPAALLAATQDWLEGAAAEVVHRQAGGVVAANQLRALLADVRAARAADVSNGLLDLLARLLDALTDSDIAGVVSELSNSGVASAWLMAHSLELMAAYPGAPPPPTATAAAAGRAAGGGGGVGSGALVAVEGGAAGGGGGGGGGGLLTRRLAVSGCDQMEYYRLAWAETLLPNCLGGGWQLALQYLAWCPQHGAAAAEALLEALRVDSRDVHGLEKVLTACRRLGLGATAAVISRVAGVDALSRGQLGGGVQWMVRASDPRRSAAALQLVGEAVEEALLARLGSYRPGALVLPGGDELEALLEWLPGGSGGGGGEDDGVGGAGEAEAGLGGRGGGGGGGGRGLTAFLVDVLRLSQAMGALSAASDANAPADDTAVRSALTAGRAALLSMVRRRTPPRRLCLPLLFYAIPLLEATSASSPATAAATNGGGPLFSSADVQTLQQWASECSRAAAVAGSGATAAGADRAQQGLGSLAALLGVADRYARDVQLALVRAVARVHVLEHSGGLGAAGALGAGLGWGPRGVGAGGGGVGGGALLLGVGPAALQPA